MRISVNTVLSQTNSIKIKLSNYKKQLYANFECARALFEWNIQYFIVTYGVVVSAPRLKSRGTGFESDVGHFIVCCDLGLWHLLLL